MKNQNNEIQVAFREQGIYYKGFGRVAKAAMVNSEIPLSGKGIYGYFCSMTGSGGNTYVGYSRILADLGMSKDAYYSNRQILIDQGYIRVFREPDMGGLFGKNIIEIQARPDRHTEQIDKKATSNPFVNDKNSIWSLGWGMIPRSAMTDTRLSIRDRGMLAYFYAFVTPDNRSITLDRAKVMRELNIGQRGFYKCYNKLIELNYITAIIQNTNGRRNNSVIVLNEYPDEEVQNKRVVQWIKSEFTEAAQSEASAEIPIAPKQEVVKQDTGIPIVPKQEVVKQDTRIPIAPKQEVVKQETAKQEAAKQETINTSLTNTGFTNTNLINISDRWIDAARKQIGYEIMKMVFSDKCQDALDLMVSVIADSYTYEDDAYLPMGKTALLGSYIKEELKRVDNRAATNVLMRFVANRGNVKNQRAYMLKALLNEVESPTQDDDEDDDFHPPAQKGS